METVAKIPRKQCSMCKDYRPLSEFFKEKKKPDGLQSRCRFCHTSAAKQWKEEAREKNQARKQELADRARAEKEA